MWPRFDPPTRVLTVREVVERGKDTLIAPGGMILAAFALIGLIIAVLMRWKPGAGQHGWPGSFAPAVAAFSGMGVGLLAAWAWNAVTAPRWWDWAIGTGVDLDELVDQAIAAKLISAADSWWRTRQSTVNARARRSHRSAL